MELIILVEAELQNCLSLDGDEDTVDQMSIKVAVDSVSQSAGQKCRFSATSGTHGDHEVIFLSFCLSFSSRTHSPCPSILLRSSADMVLTYWPINKHKPMHVNKFHVELSSDKMTYTVENNL